MPLLITAALAQPDPSASLEPPVVTVTAAQTVPFPGDLLRLILSVTNPGSPVRGDLFVGVVLPDGHVRLVEPSLTLGAPVTADHLGHSLDSGGRFILAGAATDQYVRRQTSPG